MANKLSTIFGSDDGAGSASSFVDTSTLPLLDYQEIRSEAYSSTHGGMNNWSQYANNIQQVGNINKASATQFGINFQANNDIDTNKIYHVILPFQVDSNGSISKGTANTIENSSGTGFSTTLVDKGFNNTTSGTIGGGNIGGNTATFVAYGRQYWSGGWQMMSWGGTIGNSNTVTTHSRNDYSDYNSSYAHPERGRFGMSGGGTTTPYYHMVGYNNSSYSNWSGWYYNSGSYPQHWTNNQLASYSSTSGFHPLQMADDSTWDHAGYYQYHYTNNEHGMGTINHSGNQSNQYSNQRSLWTGWRKGDEWNMHAWYMRADLAIVLNPQNAEFYTWNPGSNGWNESYGSPKKIDMADRGDFNFNASANFFDSNTGSGVEKWIRKPWDQPAVNGNENILDEVISDRKGGWAIRRVKYNSGTEKLTSKIIVHRPRTMENYIDYPHRNGIVTDGYGTWARAGNNKEILVTVEWRSNPPVFKVRTYDISTIQAKLDNSDF